MNNAQTVAMIWKCIAILLMAMSQMGTIYNV